jgi:hypothetical protein
MGWFALSCQLGLKLASGNREASTLYFSKEAIICWLFMTSHQEQKIILLFPLVKHLEGPL